MPSALPGGNRRRLPGVRASCAAALVALWGPAQAAPDDPPEARGADSSRPSAAAALREWRATTQHYEAAIEQEQSLNGPYSRALIDSLLALGLTHQEHGEPQLAADAFERATARSRSTLP
jgi:hypothetical protein